MIGAAFQSHDGFLAEPRAQPFDQMCRRFFVARTVRQKRLTRSIQRKHELAFEQDVGHRCGKHCAIEALAQHVREMVRIACRLNERERHARRLALVMREGERETLHALQCRGEIAAKFDEHAPRAEKQHVGLTRGGGQRLSRLEHGRRRKEGPRIGLPAECTIELLAELRAATA